MSWRVVGLVRVWFWPTGELVFFTIAQETQGSALPVSARVGVRIIVVGTVEGAYGFGNVMARVGYRERVGVTAAARKAAANIARPR